MRQLFSSGCIKKPDYRFCSEKTGLLRVFKLDKAESLMPEADISKTLPSAIPPKSHIEAM